jgi:hypothetical protein
VQVMVETVELVLVSSHTAAPPSSADTHVAEAEAEAEAEAATEVDRTKPTGWLQRLLQRILANMSIKVQHVVAKWEGAAATVTLACDTAHLRVRHNAGHVSESCLWLPMAPDCSLYITSTSAPELVPTCSKPADNHPNPCATNA